MAFARLPGITCQVASWGGIDPGTLWRGDSPLPGLLGLDDFEPTALDERYSGAHWVGWANAHAPGGNSVDSLSDGFKPKITAFIEALQAAGAKVKLTAMRRHPVRAYLFHWSWLIGLGYEKPQNAAIIPEADILWDHGEKRASMAAAMEMVKGFGLAVPPKSAVAPAWSVNPSQMSHHTRGDAVDMLISWTGVLKIKGKNDQIVEIGEPTNGNLNKKLHEFAKEHYKVVKFIPFTKNGKLVDDEPHWSINGH